MQRELRQDPYYVGAERDLLLMHICELLIDRHFAEGYGERCFKRHEKKWGKMRDFWEPFYCYEPGDVESDRGRWGTDWPKATSLKLEEKAREEMRACFAHKRMLTDQDIQYLFKLLSKHYRRW
ncbi:hypothetical protein [Desulfovibrio sp. Fe33]|uniref:hypothetical protein n=1 Tax=Desulfovibrio sp. Fe33 TaxID=3020842 RepID=UPI00234DF790|nr:hypothetical protein [Desulfovibrio sp. Fe33]